jgi:hypothetical protein
VAEGVGAVAVAGERVGDIIRRDEAERVAASAAPGEPAGKSEELARTLAVPASA